MKVKLTNSLLTWEKHFSPGKRPHPEDVLDLFEALTETLREKGFKGKLTLPGWFLSYKGAFVAKEEQFKLPVTGRKSTIEKLILLLNNSKAEFLQSDVKTVEVFIHQRLQFENDFRERILGAEQLNDLQDTLFTLSFFREIEIALGGEVKKYLVSFNQGIFSYLDLDFGGVYEDRIHNFASWCSGRNVLDEALTLLKEQLLQIANKANK